MKAEMLQRLFEMSKKTGDRLVVLEGDSGFVLLPLDRYEELLAVGTEGVRFETPVVAPAVHREDPIEVANKEVAKIVSQAAKSDAIKTVFDGIEGAGEVSEETFYLEPVE